MTEGENHYLRMFPTHLLPLSSMCKLSLPEFVSLHEIDIA